MSRIFSRRNFIRLGGAGLLAAAATEAEAQEPAKNDRALFSSGRRVELTSPADPGFEKQLDAFFPGLLLDPNFKSLAPLAFLVSNVSGPPLKAVSVHWSVASSLDLVTKTVFFYVRSAPQSHLSAGRHFVDSGRTRLATPLFTWTPGEYKKHAVSDWAQILNGSETNKFFARQAKIASSITVSLDAAVYSDWAVIGPDSAGLGHHLAIRRNAEHDEGVFLLKLVEQGATDAQLLQTLKGRQTIEGIAGYTVPRVPAKPRWYYRARTLQAKVLADGLSQLGRNELVRRLRALRSVPKTHIHQAQA